MHEDIRLQFEPEYSGGTTFRGFRIGLCLGLLLWALIAAVGIAVARAGDSTCGDIPLPPQQYDHVPTIPFSVRNVDYGATNRLCGQNGVGALVPLAAESDYRVLACSWHGTVSGTVILPVGGGWTDQERACVLRHELAHLNGWPASHPGAHFE